MDGFALSLLKMNDGTFKVWWGSQGVTTYEVWTSDDPYFEPGDVGSTLVESDADLHFYTPLEGESYYRVSAPGAVQPLSTVVGQLEYPLVAGYSKVAVYGQSMA